MGKIWTLKYRNALAVPLSVLFVLEIFTGCKPVPNIANETCLACHDGRSAPDLTDFRITKHNWISCEDCHGDGFAHIRSGGGPLLINDLGDDPFGKAVELCNQCHEDKVSGWENTAHAELLGAACIACHNVHNPGGMLVDKESDAYLTNEGYAQLCGDCHESDVEKFLASGHAQRDILTCFACHDMHKPTTMRANPVDNSICLQCHGSFFLGLDSEEAIDFHTGPYHPVDPVGTGSSRCISCHMPDTEQSADGNVPHDHSLATVPPLVSNDDIAAGLVPRPNSCAGVTGCHETGGTGPGQPHNVNDPEQNEIYQALYDSIGGLPNE